MKPQPYKKALVHLDKAANFQDRLTEHLAQVRKYLNQCVALDTPTITTKKKRRLK